ncbi:MULTISPECIES: hypothetical protein [unclassified Corynebacterium]|uniref:hypothetical protein n=1 Tax=unclassified Corynebacterium TaxID=2624378 RepID=UPI0003B8F4C9|nr:MULTISPECIES: hypothetical protein [unclassified Corynebacterium]ERS54611.1 hypothetical protein HMPREF1281_01084 [Corynebacterium sp. KPL1855]ERS63878.1 hypothetical protein HMPREF1257_00962 [Corynebacterium sp. KPL1814]ERS76547.1 hypothetical protein HMPREF1285_02134 [Corynebacterium sp. KPL1859]
MKKFSRFATAGLVFSAGLSLAACHPPNQQDSESGKIDNASTFTGEAPAQKDADTSSSAATTEPGADSEDLQNGIEEPVQQPNATATQLPQ